MAISSVKPIPEKAGVLKLASQAEVAVPAGNNRERCPSEASWRGSTMCTRRAHGLLQ